MGEDECHQVPAQDNDLAETQTGDQPGILIRNHVRKPFMPASCRMKDTFLGRVSLTL